jgi:hypothetical protein
MPYLPYIRVHAYMFFDVNGSTGIFCHFKFDKERNGESSLLEDI